MTGCQDGEILSTGSIVRRPKPPGVILSQVHPSCSSSLLRLSFRVMLCFCCILRVDAFKWWVCFRSLLTIEINWLLYLLTLNEWIHCSSLLLQWFSNVGSDIRCERVVLKEYILDSFGIPVSGESDSQVWGYPGICIFIRCPWGLQQRIKGQEVFQMF